MEYKNGKPVRVDTIVISTQHAEHVDQPEIEQFEPHVVVPKVIPSELIDDQTKFHVNPTGRLSLAVPWETGLTGRKIIVDTYGGHGMVVGPFLKRCLKVDRRRLIRRYAAKNLVAAGAAERCLVQLPMPLVWRSRFRSWSTPMERERSMKSWPIVFVRSFQPSLLSRLTTCLKAPIFKQTAAYGHFGERSLWEKVSGTGKAYLPDPRERLSRNRFAGERQRRRNASSSAFVSVAIAREAFWTGQRVRVDALGEPERWGREQHTGNRKWAYSGSGLRHVEDAAKPKGGALFKGLAVALYGSLEENVQSVLSFNSSPRRRSGHPSRGLGVVKVFFHFRKQRAGVQGAGQVVDGLCFRTRIVSSEYHCDVVRTASLIRSFDELCSGGVQIAAFCKQEFEV